MKNSFNIKSRDNITFGILFFVLFLIIGLYPLTSSRRIRIWSITLSLIFLFTTFIRPNLLTFFNILWIKIGFLLGKIISPIIMGIIFFFVVTPIVIFMKMYNNDVMHLKKKDYSYWINKKDKIQSMTKQF